MESNSTSNEAECMLDGNIPVILKSRTINKDSVSSSKNGSKSKAENVENKSFLNNETFDPGSSFEVHENELRNTKKLSFNKSLLSFRIIQLLWYSAGSLPGIFFVIILKQRGLSLVELSSVYSVIFICQFISCSITGIITDKIGNPKHVLMFVMFSSSCILVFLSLTPNINSESCTPMHENLNDDFKGSEISKKFSSCYFNCLFNDSTFLSSADINDKFDYENISLTKRFHNGNVSCDITFDLIKNISLDPSGNDCCFLCANSRKAYCVTDRKEHLVIVYAIFILLFYSTFSTSYRFFNFTSISVAIENNSYFGKEFAVAKCGELVVIILAGFVLNIDKASGAQINFEPLIWIAAGIILSACALLSVTTVPILPPGKNLFKNALTLVRDTDILALTLLIFVAGNGYSFGFTFRLVFLESLNAPSTLVALHSVAMTLYGFPLLLTSEWWVKKFGPHKIFVVALLFYAVNNAAYSFMYNSWWSLIIDATVSVTYYLFWITALMHCRKIAPEGFAATVNALAGAVHFGAGRSSGVFLGGMLMNYIGARKAFRIMAAIFFSSALLYSIFIYKRSKTSSDKFKSKSTEVTEMTISKNADTEIV